jgi:hypothetical protein
MCRHGSSRSHRAKAIAECLIGVMQLLWLPEDLNPAERAEFALLARAYELTFAPLHDIPIVAPPSVRDWRKAHWGGPTVSPKKMSFGA